MELYKNRNWLYHKYWGEELSMMQIADLCKVSHRTIGMWINKFNINCRLHGKAISLGRAKKSEDKPFKHKNWLYYKYVIEKLSIYQIADLCKVSVSPIHSWMEKFNIKKRTLSKAQKISCNRPEIKKQKGIRWQILYNIKDVSYRDESWLYQKYWIEKLSMVQIGKLCGVKINAIKYWMNKFNIKIRTNSEAQDIEDRSYKHKDWLYQKYIIEKKPSDEIAKTCKCDGQTILNRLKYFDIKTRGTAEFLKGRKSPHTTKRLKKLWEDKFYRKEMSKMSAGENNPNWRGGKSFEPYGPEFNKQLKEFIRKRGNYHCQECGVKENGKAHDCHHIDYNKKNNNPENFFALCESCHMKTNFNRQYWQNHFMFSMQLKVNNFINQ